MADTTTTSTSNQYYQLPTADYSTISGSITFTGLASGTDFDAIIKQLVEIESIHKKRLEAWKSTWEAKIESMRALNQRLNAIEEAAGAMDTEEEFMMRTGSTSDSSVVTATASSSAKTGAYSVTVGTSIHHVLRSVGVTSTTVDVVPESGGDLYLYIGDTLTTVYIGSTYSITSIAYAINAKVGTSIASVKDDGTTSRPYYLEIESNVGGAAGRITVTKNPTNLSFDYKDMVVADDSNWGSSTVTILGQFFGDKSTAETYKYVFSVNATSTTVTVGSDAFNLVYDVYDLATGTTISSGTTISVPASYDPDTDSLEVENGIYLKLGSGTLTTANTITLYAYANDIDDPELSTWSGVTVYTDGNYLGTTNKTYSFTVVSGGDINSGGTADTVTLRWTDSSGRTGTVSVTQSGYAYDVDMGLKLKFDAGTLVEGDTFSVNVFAPDLQQGQDKGLAQATKLVHSGFKDDTTTAVTTSSATFCYTYAGKTITVSVSAGSTLSQLVSAINSDSDNPGVTASIINDGLGLPDSYKLVLTGQDTGAAYQITNVWHDFTGSDFASGGDVGGGFSRTQWATNSMIKVDGYPSEPTRYLQRDTNQVEGVIDDVTLNLHDAGSAVITISNDVGAIYGKIEALINAVNYAQSYIRQETKYDPEGEETGLLIGNYSYYILKSRIDTALNESIDGLTDGTDRYTHLAQVGIHTDPDNDGMWVIDSSTLMEALNEDVGAVANLFIYNSTKGSTGAARRMYDEMVDLTDPDDGTLNVLIDNYNDIIDNIDKKIEREEKRLKTYEEHLRERFARLEATLSELNAQAAYLESAIQQLPGNKK